MAVAYFQPVTRGELTETFGKEISHDLIASLRDDDLIAAGPRSPKLGAPYAYATTEKFLSEFGFESLRDLPDLEALKDAGLLSSDAPIGGGRETTPSWRRRRRPLPRSPPRGPSGDGSKGSGLTATSGARAIPYRGVKIIRDGLQRKSECQTVCSAITGQRRLQPRFTIEPDAKGRSR